MSLFSPQRSELSNNVNNILDLVKEELSIDISINRQDVAVVEASLKKAIAPKFEIVLAGAFSAGKSMLINALLERELLYSAEGHATGTECHIEYAEPEAEKVVLTFLSEKEIKQQTISLCQHLGLSVEDNTTESEVIDSLTQDCAAIIEQEGGESKSERAKKAHALALLLKGFVDNRDRIDPNKNNIYSMEEFNFSNLTEAAPRDRSHENSGVDATQSKVTGNWQRFLPTSGK